MPMRCTFAWPTDRSESDRRRRATRISPSTPSSMPRAAAAPRRSIPATGSSVEDAAFARAVESAGIAFVGPPPSALEALGNKLAARRSAAEAGVPIVPGTTVALEDDVDAVAGIGYPVMLKAAAGGGGRGMRRVDGPDELRPAMEAARREAEAAFGDGTIYVERLVAPARHVEVQLLGDRHGQLAVLGERDCSVQRRHQKLVEESPSPAVDDAMREALFDSARRVAGTVDFHNAATVEFLVADGSHYFLEMNTRLQVEHGVTELVTGLDLVAWQIRIAAGERLAGRGAGRTAPRARDRGPPLRRGSVRRLPSERRTHRCLADAVGAGRARRRRHRGRHRTAPRVRPAARQADGPCRRPAERHRPPAAGAGRDPDRRAPDRCGLPALARRRPGVRRRRLRHRAHRRPMAERPVARPTRIAAWPPWRPRRRGAPRSRPAGPRLPTAAPRGASSAVAKGSADDRLRDPGRRRAGRGARGLAAGVGRSRPRRRSSHRRRAIACLSLRKDRGPTGR